MPLTNLKLTIDCRQEGWLPRAVREAAVLLGRHERPRMAAALRDEFARRPALHTLHAFFRLHLLPGDAPAGYIRRGTDLYRAQDGTRSFAGHVPRAPRVLHAPEDSVEEMGACVLVAGSYVVMRRKGNMYPTCFYGANPAKGWQEAWGFEPDGVCSSLVSDGLHLALLLSPFSGPQHIELRELETGTLLWQSPKLPQIPLDKARARLLMSESAITLYDALHGELYSLSRADGALLWQQKTLAADGAQIYCLTAGEHLCILNDRDDKVTAHSLQDGGALWDEEAGGRARMRWTDGRHLYYSFASETVRLDLEAPKRRVTVMGPLRQLAGKDPGCTQSTQAVVSGPKALMAGETWMRGLSLSENGRTLWERAVPYAPVAPMTSGGELICVGGAVLRVGANTLSAYRLEDGEPLWEDLPLGMGGHYVLGHTEGLVVVSRAHKLCFIAEAGQGEPHVCP